MFLVDTPFVKERVCHMSRKTFRLISVGGDSYECGYQHGSQAKSLVRENVDLYLRLWKTSKGLDRRLVLGKTREFIPVIERYDPDILEELRGVADGAELSLEEIIALNARYEFIWAERLGAVPSECTSMVALPEATKSGHTLLAQNWDYLAEVSDRCIILEIRQKDKPNIVMHTEAGIIGQKGLNSAGIGIVVNALMTDKDRFEPAVPFWLMCRKVLNSESFGSALSAILNCKRAVSGNIIVAHADGVAVDVEATSKDFAFIFPDKGVIAHANHFVNLRLTLSVTDKFVTEDPSSVYRLLRAKSFLDQKKTDLTIADFKQILSDHFGKPNSICLHVDPKTEVAEPEETVASVIMNLSTRTLFISNGPPCEGEYEEFNFKSLRRE